MWSMDLCGGSIQVRRPSASLIIIATFIPWKTTRWSSHKSQTNQFRECIKVLTTFLVPRNWGSSTNVSTSSLSDNVSGPNWECTYDKQPKERYTSQPHTCYLTCMRDTSISTNFVQPTRNPVKASPHSLHPWSAKSSVFGSQCIRATGQKSTSKKATGTCINSEPIEL